MLTNRYKLNLLNFILRPRMFIKVADENSIVSFIEGYEFGQNLECDFTEQLKKHLINNFKITYSNDGWPGQITRYSKKKSISWVTTFRQFGLEILTSDENGGLTEEMQELIKMRIQNLIKNIGCENPWFKEEWANECIALFAIKSTWFKNLWNKWEYAALKSILRVIKQGQAFEGLFFKPTKALLDLKTKFTGD